MPVIARKPRWFYERHALKRSPAKQRIHALLRRDPKQTSEQLALLVGCSRAYARIWKDKFFATGDGLLTH